MRTILASLAALTLTFTGASAASAQILAAAPVVASTAPVAGAAVQPVQVSSPTFASVVSIVAPSIVSVTANRRHWTAAPAPPGGKALPEAPGKGQGGQDESGETPLLPPGPSLGSGVIVSSDGYIVTNSHVIDGADEIKVSLSSGAEMQARVVGKDSKTDIAVIKIDHPNLTPALFADSSKASIGDVVLALGYPFGIGQTVTMGIISATGRGNIGLEDYEDFLQTDAAINPGNSGGALVNAQGQVVGINTAILSRDGGNQGIGFAVPANLAKNVMSSLIAQGRVIRGFLGLTAQDVTPDLAKQFGVESQGALISDVVAGGPAASAGVKPGDVIVAFDGHPVPDSRTLRLQSGQTPPGRPVPVKVRRGSKTMAMKITMREIQPRVEELPTSASISHSFAGAVLEDLTPEMHGKLEVPAEVRGALVTAIERGSPAFDSGLRPGDVVTEVARRPVASAGDVWRVARRATGTALLLRVWEGGTSHYVVVDLHG